MIFRNFIFLLFLTITVPNWVASDENVILKKEQIRETMEKMFAYHIENREFSPLIVRRSLKIYIQQFDPDYLYLLKEEVEPFLSMNDQMVNEIIDGYHRDRYPVYSRLNQIIEKSIMRSRRIRQELMQGFLEEELSSFPTLPKKENQDFAEDVQALRSRIKIGLGYEIRVALKKVGIEHPSKEILSKVMDFKESKKIACEQSYLPQKGGMNHGDFSLHVLKAMAKSLDTHSGYYSPKEAYEIRTHLRKEFCGIGIVLNEEFDGIHVIDILQGGPAYRSKKVEVGDGLLGLDNQPIEGKSFSQVLDMIQGKPGSTLMLNLKKKGGHLETVTLMREKIIVNNERLSFEAERFAEGVIGKIYIPGFYDNGKKVSVEKDLIRALRALRSHGKIHGLILDLRENAGGFLSQAVKISAMFINGGIIVVSKYASGEVSYVRDIDGRHYYSGPLVVLISKASASAAEVVSGALQDHGVALIVGDERSYGKGSMQHQTLTDETASCFFKVTVGRYYTASGRSPQITGVKSDIHVPTALDRSDIGERYAAHAIAGDWLTGELFCSLNQIKKQRFSKDSAALGVDYLKPHHSQWRKMLTQLRTNSAKRLDSDSDFQLFIKQIEHSHFKREAGVENAHTLIYPNFGVEDLQMKEAVAIIKDMALLR